MAEEVWTWTIEARLEADSQEDMELLVEHIEAQLDALDLEGHSIEGASVPDWRVIAS